MRGKTVLAAAAVAAVAGIAAVSAQALAPDTQFYVPTPNASAQQQIEALKAEIAALKAGQR